MTLRRTTVLTATAALFATGRASAQFLYEPFNYVPDNPLDANVNPGNALPWSAMTGDPPGDDILVVAGGLSYSGLPPGAGNSVAFSGEGNSERLSLGAVIASGSLFYSLLLRVDSLAGMTTTPVFVAGLSNRSGESDLQPQTVGTRLYLRKSSDTTFNIGVSKNSSATAHIAFDTTDYPTGSPVFVVGQYSINGVTQGTDDTARLYINPTELGHASAPVAPVGGSAIVTAPAGGTDLFDAGAPALAGFVLRQAVADVPGVRIDELRADDTWAQVTPPVGVSWNVDASGSWSDDPAWSTGFSPDDAGAFVTFPAVTSIPRTVTVDSPVALRTLNFTSPVGYQIDGSSALSFGASSAINVRAGDHLVAAPIALAGDFLIGVDAGRSLTISSGLSAPSSPITKSGAGTLELKHARVPSLFIAGGQVRILADGASSGVSRVESLSVASGAVLDLRNNDLVVTATPAGTWNGSTYTGVTGFLASGFNAGAWDGAGVLTSQPEANTGWTTLGVATASEVLGIPSATTAVWSGQTVTGDDALVMYTYAGDANLSGNIDIDDYTRIDSNASIGGVLAGYINGDFNYDGLSNIDDYTIIDANIGIQGPPLGTAAPLAITSIPEPVIAAPLASFCLLRRRRKSRHSIHPSI